MTQPHDHLHPGHLDGSEIWCNLDDPFNLADNLLDF
jgi:hypothetical protein